jgi:integrase
MCRVTLFFKENDNMEEIDTFIEYLLGKNLAMHTIDEYFRYYKRFQKHVRELGLTQQAVNSAMATKICHNGMFRAFLKNYLYFLHNKDIEIPKITGRPKRSVVRHISEEQVNQILEYFKQKATNERFYLMVKLVYQCGLRRQEVLNIEIDDFDWDNWGGEIDRPCRLKIRGKGNRERYVIVSQPTMIEIIQYANRNLPFRNNKLFGYLSPKTFNTKWYTMCKRVFGRPIKIHSLRHTRSWIWWKEGKDLIGIKQRLGHSSISTTQLYINPDEEDELKNWENEYPIEKTGQ